MKRKVTIIGGLMWIAGYAFNSQGVEGAWVLLLGVVGLIVTFYGISKRI